MKLTDLLREAFTAARCSPVPSALVALVVAATACVALITVGRQAALEADLARELAGPNSRTLTVTDVSGSRTLQSATVDVLRGLSGVDLVEYDREDRGDAPSGSPAGNSGLGGGSCSRTISTMTLG